MLNLTARSWSRRQSRVQTSFVATSLNCKWVFIADSRLSMVSGSPKTLMSSLSDLSKMLSWSIKRVQVQSLHLDVSLSLAVRQQSPPSYRHSLKFVSSSQIPSSIKSLSGLQTSFSVVVCATVVSSEPVNVNGFTNHGGSDWMSHTYLRKIWSRCQPQPKQEQGQQGWIKRRGCQQRTWLDCCFVVVDAISVIGQMSLSLVESVSFLPFC